MASVRWGGLRQEPYKRDAVDADNDGIVQEGTVFERPVGSRLLSSGGEDVLDGLSGVAVADISDFTLVDSVGSPIQYRQSWRQQSLSVGDQLGRIGTMVGTLNNFPTVGSIVNPPVPEPVKAPEVPDEPDASPIRKKNRKVLDKLKSVGGRFRLSDMTPEERAEFTKKETTKAGYQGYRFDTTPPADQLKQIARNLLDRERKGSLYTRIDDEKAKLEDFKKTSNGPDDPIILATEKSIRILEARRDYLESTPEDQIVSDMVSFFRVNIEDEDTKIGVQMPEGRFELMLESGGEYKTTHEARSQHSGAHIRRGYEAAIGIPADANSELRPASGYIIYGARDRFVRSEEARRAAESGMDMDTYDSDADEAVRRRLAGGAGAYGRVQIILRNDVKDRTKFGVGDSFNNTIDAAPVTDATDDELLAQAVGYLGGKGGGNNSGSNVVQHIIDHMLTDRPDLIGADYREFDDVDIKNKEDYHEALIFGSFDLSEVERIVVPAIDAEGVTLLEEISVNDRLRKIISPEDIELFTQFLTSNPREVRKLMTSQEMNVQLSILRISEQRQRDEFAAKVHSIAKDIKISWETKGKDYSAIIEKKAQSRGITTDALLYDELFSQRWSALMGTLRSGSVPLVPAPVEPRSFEDVRNDWG